MPSDPTALDDLSRDELIAKARQLGALRPELLTRPELRDEIIRLSELDASERQRARGWFGVARDLVASVVSQGLHLPDKAELIRAVNIRSPNAGPPVATVTLAEIYAAQGHVSKALSLLDEVLEREPDHEAARLARQRFAPEIAKAVPLMPPEPEEEPLEALDAPETQVGEGESWLAPTAAAVLDPEAPAPEASEPEGSEPEVSEPEVSEPEASPTQPEQPVQSADDATSAASDEDLLFLVSEEGHAPVCLWQLGRRTVSRLGRGLGGSLVLKVVEIQPSWDGPRFSETLLLVEGERGRRGLETRASELRVVLGCVELGRFRPLCVGAVFEVSPLSGVTLRWSPPGAPREVWEQRGQVQLPSLLGASFTDS